MATKTRPTEGAPGDQELVTLCEQAERVKRLCDVLGFEFRGASPLLEHLRGAITSSELELRTGHPDPLEVLEDPDLRPYIWDIDA